MLFIPVGIAFSIVLFGLAWIVGDAFAVGPEQELALALAAVVGFGYPFQAAGEHLARGIDRIHLAALANVLFQVLFVGALLALIAVGAFEAGAALVLRSVALAGSGLALAVLLRPLFTHVRPLAREVLVHTRQYGFQLYLGRLLSIGTYNMDVLLLGIWADAERSRFYALAVALAAASGLPVIAPRTPCSCAWLTRAHIESRWLALAGGAGLAIALRRLPRRGSAVDLVSQIATTTSSRCLFRFSSRQAIRGVTTVYNVFLSAHGRGRELRNAGLVLTASNIVLIFALIPLRRDGGRRGQPDRADVQLLRSSHLLQAIHRRRPMKVVESDSDDRPAPGLARTLLGASRDDEGSRASVAGDVIPKRWRRHLLARHSGFRPSTSDGTRGASPEPPSCRRAHSRRRRGRATTRVRSARLRPRRVWGDDRLAQGLQERIPLAALVLYGR